MHCRRLAIALICASSWSLEAQSQIVSPQRISPPQTSPGLPPLPADADQVKAVTMDVRFQGRPATVVRTATRVLIRADAREWLFERNPVDVRRVSATIAEHNYKTIVSYEESDVRNLLGINGWADVLDLTSERGAPRYFQDIVRVRDGVDGALIEPMQIRFPLYKSLQVADWLERH